MKPKLTLSELNEQIRDALAGAFPSTVWVVAEISELKENRNGHCYLELIEKSGNQIIARSRATIWSYTYRMLKPYFETTTGQLFAQDIKVLVQVSVDYHPAYGLSLNIRDIDPAYTAGDLALQRKEILERLQADGVISMNRELQLPLVPQKIAVISSPTAAGYQDFMAQLQNNEYGFRFYTHIFEAWMQGEGSVASIIRALERIYDYADFFDAVAIIRGGGATADLNCFDNYDLAFHITQFPIPVVTGIGHEKDDTIIDMVAHTRLKTPTAVAEFFIDGVERFYARLLESEREIAALTRQIIRNGTQSLEKYAAFMNQTVKNFIQDRNSGLLKKGNQLHRSVSRYVYKRNSELAGIRHRSQTSCSSWKAVTIAELNQKHQFLKDLGHEKLAKEKNHLRVLHESVSQMCIKRLTTEKDRLRINENMIRLLDPVNVLKRGYSITLSEGKVVKSIEQAELGGEIETWFADGKTYSRIIKKEYNDKENNLQGSDLGNRRGTQTN